MKFFLKLIITSLFVFSSNAHAQYYQIKNYTTNNGLLSNEVYKFYQDSKGLLWVFNGRGFSAFDGKTFKNFILRKPLFPTNGIIEKSNSLMFNFDEGIAKFDYFGLKTSELDNNILKVYIPDKGAYKLNPFYIDKDGFSVLIKHPFQNKTTDTICYTEGSIKVNELVFSINKKDTFSSRIFADNKNTIWLNIDHKDPVKQTNLMSLYYFEKGKLIPFIQNISAFQYDKIFVSSKNEIYLIDKNKLFKFSKNNTIDSLTFNYGYATSNTSNIVEDSKGTLWLSYFKGLIEIKQGKVKYIENPERKIVSYSSTSYDIEGNKIITNGYADSKYADMIKVDSRDNIICSNEIYNGKTFTTLDIGKEQILSDVLVDKEDQIWYATTKGIFVATRINIKQLDLNGSIFFVSKDGRQILTERDIDDHFQMIYLYKDLKISDSTLLNRTERYGVSSKEIFEASKGIILISSRGLHHITDGRFQVQKLETNSTKTKITSFVYLDFKSHYAPKGLFCDNKGYAWGVTAEKGYLFKTDGEKYWYYGKEDGIQDTIIYNENFTLKKLDYFFTSNGIYYFSNEKFYLVKNSSQNFQSYSINILGQRGNSLYFSKVTFGNTKEYQVFRIYNNTLEEYTITNKDNSLFADNWNSYINIGTNFLTAVISKGFTKQIIDDNTKTFTNVFFNCNPAYIPWIPYFKLLNKKLIVFEDGGPIQIYHIKDAESDSLPTPILLRDFANFVSGSFSDTTGKVYATNINNRSVMLNSNEQFISEYIPITYFLKFSFFGGDSISIHNDLSNKILLPYNFNPLRINYKAVCLTDGGKLKYQYKLNGLDENWSETSEDNLSYSSLPVGTYTLQVKACNNDGIWNDKPTEIIFEVLPPWQRTWWAYTLYVFAAFAAIRGYLKNRTKKLEKEKKKLEKTVEERTAEVTLQKHLIEEKHKEITDSIHYAKRIQTALLPTEKYIDRNLNDLQKDKDKKK